MVSSDAALENGWHRWSFGQASDYPATARATQEFIAYSGGNVTASEALTKWFRDESTEPYVSTYIKVEDGLIAAFVALQSSSVSLHAKAAKKLRIPDETRVPATLITHVARHESAESGRGREAILYAAAIARRANLLQRTAVLVLDPFDKETQEMWSSRFKFQQSVEMISHDRQRLYIPLRRG